MESANVRNLEQIQEEEPRRRPSRLAALVLCSMAGSAIVVAGVMNTKRQGPASVNKDDPLATLVAEAKSSNATPAEKLDGTSVSFPELLSDQGKPTTALAAVKDERGNLLRQENFELPPGSPTTPPPAGDRLSVMPLPAGTLLSSTPITTQPKDRLTALAATKTKLDEAIVVSAPGAEGGYQIQVASFKQAPDADVFAEDLRKRGHKAYRQAAYVPERGLWHRVRIGPFKTKFEAIKYKEKFESTERVSPFVVDPDKVRQAEESRNAKLEARKKRYGRP
jgi:cell division protein FtsN